MGGGPAETTNSSSEFSDYCIVSEVSRVKLLYSKSKVYVYRSMHKKDRIPGFICVVQGPDDQYYIAWTPEALMSEHDRESYVQVELCPSFFDESTGRRDTTGDGAQVSLSMLSEDGGILVSTEPLHQAGTISSVSSYAFCKPVGEILSLLIHPPSLTQWYGSVIINLADGSSLAPMWFHDEESASTMLGMTRHWGGDELLVWLAHAVSIERSIDDPNRYEVQGSKSPHIILSRSATPSASTMLPAHSTFSSPTPLASPPQAQAPKAASVDIIDSAIQGNMDPLMQQVKELRWGILERFSRITRTVKDAATSFIETPVGRQVAPYIPPALSSLSRAQSASGNLVKEYESARIYLAKWAARHIIDQQHEDGERESRLAAGDKHGSQGNSHLSIWEEWISENGDLGAFEVVNTDRSARLPQPIRTRPALSAEQWFSFFEPKATDGDNSEFRLVADSDTVRRAIFAGGIEEDMRPVVWKYLLSIYPWDSSESERKSIDKHNSEEYWNLKDAWLSDPELKETRDHIEQSDRIEKDVLRTDRTLPLFATDSVYGGSDEANLSEHGLPGSNASLEQMKDILMTFHYYDKGLLGYVQGMSDLLAPIYSVYQDEPTTFWAFASFMKRMRSHFARDQSGMQDELATIAQLIEIANPKLFSHLEKCDASNMFSCYRWLLIWFKREFSFENILRLWEVLWTDYLTDRFVLFVALAILQRHADVIMDHLQSPEEVLKYVQDLSDTIDLNDALKGAEMSFYKIRYRVHVVEEIRKERGLSLFVSSSSSSDEGQATEAASSKSKSKSKSPVVEKTRPSAQGDSEVPLITFEWDESENNSSQGTPAVAVAVVGSAVNETLSTGEASGNDQAVAKTSLAQSVPALGPSGVTSNLPEISEAVHNIFAHGYKL
ncbi:GTPase activating protein [Kickxella alabastrina]|uniref:GTPase activating protein n=1 Tax=Kickxella alabastrina TaxID=61397 RepID=A0ACC1IWG7_9FUNG|nr:GTPase activating protein [Kickxella alabastrina]